MRIWNVRRDRRPPRGDGPLLAARPIAAATHYQLHSGLLREAFAAERESFPSAFRRRFYRLGLFLNAHRRAILRAEDRLLRKSAAALMVFSETLRNTIVARSGVSRDRVTLDRPGVDLGVFHPPEEVPAASAAPALRLLFVGHNFELKGLRTALSALALLPGASLTVAGGGPAARFRRFARHLGIAERVRFDGALDAAAVAGRYRRSDALVHPTFYDPCPLVVLEALATGLPVVTTRRCGASEILPAEARILIEDPRDSRSLAQALARLADRDFRRRMGAAALAAPPDSAGAHFERVRIWLGLG